MYWIITFLLNMMAKLKVISIRDRLSTLCEAKFTIIIIYDRLVALCYASVTVLLMYNALFLEVPAGRSIAVLCPLSGTGPVCPMIHRCLSLGQGLWFTTYAILFIKILAEEVKLVKFQ